MLFSGNSLAHFLSFPAQQLPWSADRTSGQLKVTRHGGGAAPGHAGELLTPRNRWRDQTAFAGADCSRSLVFRTKLLPRITLITRMKNSLICAHLGYLWPKPPDHSVAAAPRWAVEP